MISKELRNDFRWLLTAPALFGIAGVWAVTIGLLPQWLLGLPWWARLTIGGAGAVALALTVRPACRWVMRGDR